MNSTLFGFRGVNHEVVMGDVATRPSEVSVAAGLSDVYSNVMTAYPCIVKDRAYEFSEYQMKVARV